MKFYSSKVGDNIPPRILEISEQVKRGEKPPRETVRALLNWFGVERRGFYVVLGIERILKKLELETYPNFEYAFIDSFIEFRPLQKPEEGNVQENQENANFTESNIEPNIINSTSSEAVAEGFDSTPPLKEFTDPTYRIGRLESANNHPISIKPESSLQEIVTKMLAHDFSQLPVMTSERDVKGVVSWTSIGKRLAMGTPCNVAKDCMELHHEINADTSLFYAIDTIVEHEYVLVRDSSKVITGIVTTTDLSMQFLTLGEPFLLIGEIENQIRKLINGKFVKEDLSQVRNPADGGRQVEEVSDLTFGEYIRLIENQAQWNKLNLNLDRSVFIGLLDEVRVIRNDVMHFDPDGISESDLDTLRKFVALLQGLSKIGVI